MTGQELIEHLREAYPDIAIVITKEVDSDCVWDGDGPDPVDLDFLPYDVDVTAVRIHKGRLIKAKASLGSVYMAPDELMGEVHGYLPQMVREAVNKLLKATEGEDFVSVLE